MAVDAFCGLCGLCGDTPTITFFRLGKYLIPGDKHYELRQFGLDGNLHMGDHMGDLVSRECMAMAAAGTHLMMKFKLISL